MAVSVHVKVAPLVQLVSLGGGTNASAGNGRDILPVRRCEREVEGVNCEVHVGGMAAFGKGLGWAWLEKVWFFRFRIGASF